MGQVLSFSQGEACQDIKKSIQSLKGKLEQYQGKEQEKLYKQYEKSKKKLWEHKDCRRPEICKQSKADLEEIGKRLFTLRNWNRKSFRQIKAQLESQIKCLEKCRDPTEFQEQNIFVEMLCEFHQNFEHFPANEAATLRKLFEQGFQLASNFKCESSQSNLKSDSSHLQTKPKRNVDSINQNEIQNIGRNMKNKLKLNEIPRPHQKSQNKDSFKTDITHKSYTENYKVEGPYVATLQEPEMSMQNDVVIDVDNVSLNLLSQNRQCHYKELNEDNYNKYSFEINQSGQAYAHSIASVKQNFSEPVETCQNRAEPRPDLEKNQQRSNFNPGQQFQVERKEYGQKSTSNNLHACQNLRGPSVEEESRSELGPHSNQQRSNFNSGHQVQVERNEHDQKSTSNNLHERKNIRGPSVKEESRSELGSYSSHQKSNLNLDQQLQVDRKKYDQNQKSTSYNLPACQNLRGPSVKEESRSELGSHSNQQRSNFNSGHQVQVERKEHDQKSTSNNLHERKNIRGPSVQEESRSELGSHSSQQKSISNRTQIKEEDDQKRKITYTTVKLTKYDILPDKPQIVCLPSIKRETESKSRSSYEMEHVQTSMKVLAQRDRSPFDSPNQREIEPREKQTEVASIGKKRGSYTQEPSQEQLSFDQWEVEPWVRQTEVASYSRGQPSFDQMEEVIDNPPKVLTKTEYPVRGRGKRCAEICAPQVPKQEAPKKELEILDVHQYFKDEFDFNSINELPVHEGVYKLRQYAETFEEKVKSFDGEKFSLEYFVLDEKLMRIIEKLDKLKCDEQELRNFKIKTIEYIKWLHQILDQQAKED